MNPPRLLQIRVLLAEDDAFIRGSLKRMLRSLGASEVREAVDGTEALEALDSGFKPDLVISDVEMTPMDGLTFVRRLRSATDPERSSLPVVMLTGVNDEVTIGAATNLKISGYLLKPISPKLLGQRVHAIFRERMQGPTDTPDRVELHRLLYFSRFSSVMPGDRIARDGEIDRIVETSVRNNAVVDVTGLLLIHQDCFVQALEGIEKSIMTIYDRIRLDPRHEGVTVIGMELAADRKFQRWQMCARHLGKADAAILQTLDLKGAFDPANLTPSKALRLLTMVADIKA